jgi:hypothetical protein
MSSLGAVSNPFSMASKMPPMYANAMPPVAPASVSGAPINMWCPPVKASVTANVETSSGHVQQQDDVQDGAQPLVSFGVSS